MVEHQIREMHTWDSFMQNKIYITVTFQQRRRHFPKNNQSIDIMLCHTHRIEFKLEPVVILIFQKKSHVSDDDQRNKITLLSA